MSLVGSLEDLGLGDILQIITLSRKSGSLFLRSDGGEGRVIFRDGLVCGARVKGQTPDWRGLLVDAGALSETDFEAVRSAAAQRGTVLSQALSEKVASDRLEALRRECVERAVLTMFAWETGEFSFEVGEDAPDDEFEVTLDAGINAQYLAMEGTRRTDEQGRAPEASPDDVASFADVAEEIAADETPADAMARATVEKVEASGAASQSVEEALEAALAPETSSGAASGAPATASQGPSARARPRRGDPSRRPPVVALDTELPVLEWVKRTLEGTFRRVHIFQKAELAVERLRQYMGRGQSPVVLVSPTLALERAQGFCDVEDLVTRMKKQSPRSPVLWLGERADVAPADGAVPCADFQRAGRSGPDESVAGALRAGLLTALGEDPGAAPGEDAGAAPGEDAGVAPGEDAGVAPGEDAEPVVEAEPGRPLLAEVLARLEDPATRGEVLNVVLEFASRHFERVALFAVRGGEAQGLAGVGLEKAGGPDDEALRALELRTDEVRWFQRVLEGRAAAAAGAEGDGDRALSASLGEVVPSRAWLAPVISRDEVVAVLYGDNLPEQEPWGATDELEAVLAAAGRVLDEALAERARGAG